MQKYTHGFVVFVVLCRYVGILNVSVIQSGGMNGSVP
jgi:hypothetical protein